MSKFEVVFWMLCLLLLSACGTHGSHTASDQKQNTKSNASSVQFEQQFLAEVNKIRAQARVCGNKKLPAVPALILNNKLTDAAYKHSTDMSANQFLEHVSSNGDTLAERMRDVNYIWSAVGENLAHNQKTIQQVISDWLASPGHCSNLMSADYTQAGVAVVGRYWTQVYATPKQ